MSRVVLLAAIVALAAIAVVTSDFPHSTRARVNLCDMDFSEFYGLQLHDDKFYLDLLSFIVACMRAHNYTSTSADLDAPGKTRHLRNFVQLAIRTAGYRPLVCQIEIRTLPALASISTSRRMTVAVALARPASRRADPPSRPQARSGARPARWARPRSPRCRAGASGQSPRTPRR